MVILIICGSLRYDLRDQKINDSFIALMFPSHFRMGEGKKRILRKSALVFDDPLEAYECARKVRKYVVRLCNSFYEVLYAGLSWFWFCSRISVRIPLF